MLVVVAIVIAAAFAYFEYNREPADLTSLKAQVTVSAIELVNEYETNEEVANARYLGKTVDVTGIIAEINNQKDTLVNVMLGDAAGLHKISCLLSSTHAATIQSFEINDSITLRGICTGYLMDVELNRCVIIKK